MPLLGALLLAHAALLGAPWAIQLDGRELSRAGNTYSPTTRPRNLPGGTIILTPGVQVSGKFIERQALLVRYAPQIMLQFPGVQTAGPAVLQHFEGTYGVGDAREIRFT